MGKRFKMFKLIKRLWTKPKYVYFFSYNFRYNNDDETAVGSGSLILMLLTKINTVNKCLEAISQINEIVEKKTGYSCKTNLLNYKYIGKDYE